VITIAGSGVSGNADGPGAQALFANPVNLDFGPGGILYVMDYRNDAMRAIAPDFTVSTAVSMIKYAPFGIVGTDSVLYAGTDTDPATTSSAVWRVDLQTSSLVMLANGFGQARGLGLLADGTLVFSDVVDHVLRHLDPTTGTVTLLAGMVGTAGWQDNVGALATFNVPYDMVVLPDQSIVVADTNNHRLRGVRLDGTVTTVAGDGADRTKDGVGLTASFEQPKSLALDAAGNIYIGDDNAAVVRRLSPDGRVVTVAGTVDTHGFQDALDPLQAQFFHLEGITVHGRYLYVADGDVDNTTIPSDRIRRVDLQSLPP
jgi:streptogramin lyase